MATNNTNPIDFAELYHRQSAQPAQGEQQPPF